MENNRRTKTALAVILGGVALLNGYLLLPLIMRLCALVPGLGDTVTVRVVDEQGKPVPDVLIRWSEKRLTANQVEEDDQRESSTDANGVCTLHFILAAYLSSVSREGYYPPPAETQHALFERGRHPAVFTVRLLRADPPVAMAVTSVQKEWGPEGPSGFGLRMVDTGAVGAEPEDDPHSRAKQRKCVTDKREKADLWVEVGWVGEPYQGRYGVTRDWRITLTGQNGWELAPGPPRKTEDGGFSDPLWRVPEGGYAARASYNDKNCPAGLYLRWAGGRKYGKIENIQLWNDVYVNPQNNDFSAVDQRMHLLLSVQLEATGSKSLNPLRGAERRSLSRNRIYQYQQEGPYPLFMFAAEIGSLPEVVKQVEAGRDVNGRDMQDLTALMHAARRGKLEVVRYLLDHGADPNLTYREDPEGERPLENAGSALSLAAEGGHAEVVRLLVERGADIEQELFWEYTALMKACEKGQAQSALTLLEIGADVNHCGTAKDYPLLCAAASGDVNTLAILLKWKADLECEDVAGYNALHRAIEKRRIEMVKYLLNQGMDPNHPSHTGTPLRIAREKNFPEIVDILVKAGAKE